CARGGITTVVGSDYW
nr:immunoglobulin heavy chain junction region [Mus musculus]